MAIAIFILMLLSLYHFIYEGILMPTVRHELRYKFFALRDRVRLMQIESDEVRHDSVANDLDVLICATIKGLPYFNASSIYQNRKEMESNEELKLAINKKIEEFESTQNAELLKIYHKNLKYAAIGLTTNVGSWTLYFTPLIVISILIKGFSSIYRGIKSSASSLVMTTELGMKGYFHQGPTRLA